MQYNWIHAIDRWKSRYVGIPLGQVLLEGNNLVRLSSKALSSHSLVVGRPQMGKTAVLTHLASRFLIGFLKSPF